MAQVKPIEGIKEVLYIERIRPSDSTRAGGKLIPLQESHSVSAEFESDTYITKTQTLVRVSKPVETIDITMVASADKVFEDIEEGVFATDDFRLWKVNLQSFASGKADAVMYEGKFTSWQEEATSEDYKTISTNFQASGKDSGKVTISDSDIEEINSSVKFVDIDIK